MLVNILVGDIKDIICCLPSIDLFAAINTLNASRHNGFDCWEWDQNLQLIIVKHPNIKLVDSYYYTLTEKEAILLAQNYQENIFRGAL